MHVSTYVRGKGNIRTFDAPPNITVTVNKTTHFSCLDIHGNNLDNVSTQPNKTYNIGLVVCRYLNAIKCSILPLIWAVSQCLVSGVSEALEADPSGLCGERRGACAVAWGVQGEPLGSG